MKASKKSTNGSEKRLRIQLSPSIVSSNRPGFFARARRSRGRLDPSLEILFKTPKDPIKLVRPDIWWKERAILTRSLVYKKKYALAYRVSSNHSLKEGPEYAEAEWLSGWISLTFLDDPNMALQHFKNFYNNVGYPIRLSLSLIQISEHTRR